tara:strand:+ start:68 stop:238 length:171 start_codon:yes stop_codon:yes gene_type:complete
MDLAAPKSSLWNAANILRGREEGGHTVMPTERRGNKSCDPGIVIWSRFYYVLMYAE